MNDGLRLPPWALLLVVVLLLLVFLSLLYTGGLDFLLTEILDLFT